MLNVQNTEFISKIFICIVFYQTLCKKILKPINKINKIKIVNEIIHISIKLNEKTNNSDIKNFLRTFTNVHD